MRTTPNLRLVSAGAGIGVGAIVLATTAAALTRRLRRARALRRPVRELMASPVRCVGEHESVAQTAERLAQDGIGAVAVCDSEQRLVGMLSDRDIVVRVIAQGTGAEHVRAGEYAQRDPVALSERDTAQRALKCMATHRVRRLPVLRGPRVVGMITYSDLVSQIAPSDAVWLLNVLTAGAADEPTGAWLFGRAYTARGRDDRARRQRRVDKATAAQAIRDMSTSTERAGKQ